jgi:hypothetical protein
MKRPFVAAVSFYAIGLLLAELFKPLPAVLFTASFLTLVLVFTLKKFRPFLLCLLLVLAGWTNLVFRTAIISPNDLRRLIGDQTEIAIVRGVLIQTPQIRVSERHGDETEHSLTQVRVTAIGGDENWQPADGEIIVSMPGVPPTNFFAGQSVEISGVIAWPPPPLAEGLFDDRDYLQARGIFYELKTESAEDWRLCEPILSTPPLTDRFLDWSRRTLARGLPEDETLRLLWAMTLGWRTAFTGDVGDPFLRAGTILFVLFQGMD